jgi:hypothetical protein
MKTSRAEAQDLRELLETTYGVEPKEILDYILNNWMEGFDALEAINDFRADLVNG